MPNYFRWQYQAKAEPVITPAAAPAAPDFGWYQQSTDPSFSHYTARRRPHFQQQSFVPSIGTRFYLPSIGTPDPAFEPTFSPDWEDTSIAVRRPAPIVKGQTGVFSFNFTDTDDTDKDVLYGQFVSAPIRAITFINPTIKFQIRASEVSVDNNLFTTLGIRVLAPDGSLRGTLLSVTRDDVELALGPSANRRFVANPTVTVAALEGDRIVIELGVGGDPTDSLGTHSSTLRIGNGAAADHAENDTETANLTPWVEISTVIYFIPFVLDIFSQSPEPVIRGKVRQYQDKAEPLYPIVAAAAVNLEWWQQPSEPVRRKSQVLESSSVRGLDSTELAPNSDWFLQPTDQFRRRPLVNEGFFASGFDNTEISPDFDWFHQQADVVRRKLIARFGLYVTAQEIEQIEVDLDWYVQNVERVPRLREKAREGFFARGYDAAELDPSFDWWQQHLDRTPRRIPQTQTGYSAFVDFGISTVQAPSFGWWRQQADLLRPTKRVREGFYARGYPATTLAPSFGWWRQPSDPVRPKRRVQLGYSVGLVVDTKRITPSFGWFVSHLARVPRRRPQTQIGWFATSQIATTEPRFGWWRQQADLFRRKPQARTGFYSLVEFTTPVIFDLDWLVAQPNILRRKIQRHQGFYALVEFSVPVAFDLDWFIHPPDVVRRKKPAREGFFAKGYSAGELAPSFGWWKQQSDLFRRRPLVPQGLSALVEFNVPVVLDIDWLVQQPDLIRRTVLHPSGLYTFVELRIPFDWLTSQQNLIRRKTVLQVDQPAVFEIFREVDIGWLLQQADVIRRQQHVRLGFYSFITFSELVVPDFDWFIQLPSKIFVPRRLVNTGSSILVEFSVPIVPVVSVVTEEDECLEPGEEDISADPSGFLWNIDIAIPSDFTADSEEIISPSGSDDEEDIPVDPSEFTVDSEEIIPPSGYEEPSEEDIPDDPSAFRGNINIVPPSGFTADAGEIVPPSGYEEPQDPLTPSGHQ